MKKVTIWGLFFAERFEINEVVLWEALGIYNFTAFVRFGRGSRGIKYSSAKRRWHCHVPHENIKIIQFLHFDTT